MGRLDDRVALVSGGARGLGRAMAEVFVEEGARVVIGDVLGDEAHAAAEAIGDRCLAVRLDVTSEASWSAATQATVEHFGALHVLVNNAGTAEGSLIMANVSMALYRMRGLGMVKAFTSMGTECFP